MPAFFCAFEPNKAAGKPRTGAESKREDSPKRLAGKEKEEPAFERRKIVQQGKNETIRVKKNTRRTRPPGTVRNESKQRVKPKEKRTGGLESE